MSNGDITKIIDELSFDLSSESEDTRRHALLSLTSLPVNTRIVALVETTAREDSSDQLRYIARKYIDKLSKKNQPVDSKPVTSVKPPKTWDKCNRQEKLIIASKLVQDKCVNRLDEIILLLKKEKDDWVIASLLKVIGVLGSVNEVSVIQPYLNHSDPRIQANAIEALECIDDDIIVPLLLPMLERKDHRICSNAAKAIYRFDKERAVSILKEKASSEKLWYRDSALHCIDAIHDHELHSIVLSMYEGEFDEGLRKKERAFLEKAGIEIPEIKTSSTSLFDDGTVEPPPISDDSSGDRHLSSKETSQRLERLMTPTQTSLFQRFAPYLPVVGLFVGCSTLLMTGYALFFGGGSDLRAITRAVKTLSPFVETGCSFKGTVVNFTGTVIDFNPSKLTVLVEFDNRRVLLTASEELPEKLMNGSQVYGTCEITGKTRFGSVYGKIRDISVR